MIRNLRCTVTIDSVLANSKTQNAFLFTVNAIFLHDYPLAVEPGTTPRPLVQKKTWRDSLLIDMLPFALSVLVVAQSSSEIPEGLMNNPVHTVIWLVFVKVWTRNCGPRNNTAPFCETSKGHGMFRPLRHGHKEHEPGPIVTNRVTRRL